MRSLSRSDSDEPSNEMESPVIEKETIFQRLRRRRREGRTKILKEKDDPSDDTKDFLSFAQFSLSSFADKSKSDMIGLAPVSITNKPSKPSVLNSSSSLQVKRSSDDHESSALQIQSSMFNDREKDIEHDAKHDSQTKENASPFDTPKPLAARSKKKTAAKPKRGRVTKQKNLVKQSSRFLGLFNRFQLLQSSRRSENTPSVPSDDSSKLETFGRLRNPQTSNISSIANRSNKTIDSEGESIALEPVTGATFHYRHPDDHGLPPDARQARASTLGDMLLIDSRKGSYTSAPLVENQEPKTTRKQIPEWMLKQHFGTSSERQQLEQSSHSIAVVEDAEKNISHPPPHVKRNRSAQSSEVYLRSVESEHSSCLDVICCCCPFF